MLIHAADIDLGAVNNGIDALELVEEDIILGGTTLTAGQIIFGLESTDSSVGSSSPIEVLDIRQLPKDGKIELITTYKSIDLSLPSDADVAVSARTRYGKITSDYPVYLSGADMKTKEIQLGEGTIPVRLETTGNINIKKQ